MTLKLNNLKLVNFLQATYKCSKINQNANGLNYIDAKRNLHKSKKTTSNYVDCRVWLQTNFLNTFQGNKLILKLLKMYRRITLMNKITLKCNI